MSTDVVSRLNELDKSLAEFKPTESAPASSGDIFNALLAEAKRQKGQDPIISAIEPVDKTFADSEFADIGAGALSTVIRQLVTALQE